MRLYETIYILNPNTTLEDTRKVGKAVHDAIVAGGGRMSKIEDWGVKKLAYLVKKFSRGHYILYEYAGTGPIVKELERLLKISEWCIKYQTVKTADDAKEAELPPFNFEEYKFQGPHEGPRAVEGGPSTEGPMGGAGAEAPEGEEEDRGPRETDKDEDA